jgi:glycosyltransferase involved in cell wall biosynthesis
MELTILMPCLNEAETLAVCIRKARGFLQASGIDGEVLIADNGSTDGSREIAAREGARVAPVAQRGYGAALLGGIDAARGTYVIMGDADDSYDFSTLQPFVDELRRGADVVMGNRFRGGIAPGAMPFLHRYLGNPVLSWLGRLFFRIRVGDFHCGLRGFNCARIRALSLQTTGMEFASEMVVRAALGGYRLVEVPTTLAKDGRSRPPHLRTWRDGWRHLSFLLMFSPRWLFLYPGVAMLMVGIIASFALLPGPYAVGAIKFDIHTFIVACVLALIGTQAISFALIARQIAAMRGMLPPSPRMNRLLDAFTLNRILIIAVLLVALGFGGLLWCAARWASIGFGSLEYSSLLRTLVLSMTAMAVGVQMALAGFLSAIVSIPVGSGRAGNQI